MLHRASASILALVLLGGPGPTASASEPRQEGRRGDILRLLHDGRFDEADELLGDGKGVPPGPERDFLQAFVLYWRLLYDDDNPTLREAFSTRLETTLAASDARSKEAPHDAEARLLTGTAHLFLAELRASERRPFAAAMEARRARRALSMISDGEPSRDDAGFGLGTVDVLAEELPTLAKGVGSVLGLSGNRDRGLRELSRAATRGHLLALESRLFLLSVHSSRKKRSYAGALAEARRVAEFVPRSVAALDGAARVRIMLGDARAALADVDAALAIAAGAPRTDRGVVASLLLRAAKAEIVLFRPDLAAERLRSLLDLGPGLPAGSRKEAQEVARPVAEAMGSAPWLVEVAPELGAPPPAGSEAARSGSTSWSRAIPSLELERAGEIAAAADALDRLASESADDPVLWLLAGRGALLAGRHAAARERLARAESSPALPRAWLGPCLLLSGRAADAAGDRAAAVALYRRATEAPGFVEKEAAWLHLSVPYGASR